MTKETEDINEEVVDIDLVAIAAGESIKEEITEPDDGPQLSDTEQKAFDQGWRPLDEFSGPEDNWKTAKEYVRDGEFLATIKEQNQKIDRMQTDFAERTKNLNKLNDAKRASEIADLKAQQRLAVDERDTDAFDDATTKINRLESEATPEVIEQPKEDPLITSWRDGKDWLDNDDDDRTIFTVGAWNQYINKNPNATTSEALDHVNSKIKSSRLFTEAKEANPRRSQPNVTENNQRSSKRQSKSLSMSDLTAAELNDWNKFGSMMFTQEEFLKSIKDTRVK